MLFPRLNFPVHEIKLRRNNGKLYVLDPIRQIYVRLTPEEWVRQNTIQYLMKDCSWPRYALHVEAEVLLAKTKKRVDILAIHPNEKSKLIVECKAPTVSLNQAVLDQVNRYNSITEAELILITNGLVHKLFRKSKEAFSIENSLIALTYHSL